MEKVIQIIQVLLYIHSHLLLQLPRYFKRKCEQNRLKVILNLLSQIRILERSFKYVKVGIRLNFKVSDSSRVVDSTMDKKPEIFSSSPRPAPY